MISDFYRPARVAHLFSDSLTPMKGSNSSVSRARVHVAMQELEINFARNGSRFASLKPKVNSASRAPYRGFNLLFRRRSGGNKIRIIASHARECMQEQTYFPLRNLPCGRKILAARPLKSSPPLSNGLVSRLAGPTTRYQFTISKSDLA
jgi:hypothetical protein